ncbi:Ferredoxin reductase [[Actinomadura] parvosata subsp. kistnae]|uniref:FAD-dependent oxidoreductase n=1 Tax=[Actinomadura] parvosata subsp. kistnae TaxID=1909395 RepID=A0A1U9ZYN8_9ACTN|nr:FAD/NAD(P)-binding oxidoreductase [Nonomuraea sp. ATCC 55076]AQZ63076.1 FAD-dependent oxidoreductase [Nonomuraea sp. ATCC 55076]SPL98699.1 Ferredoxin reductase [Actinomadura parvosata subsp. kistnae]
MRKLNSIVIAGASLAGLRAFQALRREGFDGTITLVGAEKHLPYNRPPLSKSMLRGDDEVTLPGAEELGDRWLKGRHAVRLDTSARRLILDDGSEIPYDGLVIATGASPRRLPDAPEGVYTLRTIEDSLALRAELAAGPSDVVVIGGGFIGGEVASTARALGLGVTLVDASPYPMHNVLGTETARWLAGHHRDNGVELVSETRVTGFEGNGRVTGVRLSDGRTLPADLVIAGIGVVPNTDWLDGSGLTMNDGVVCDERLFASGAQDVVAAGDVARWPHSLYGGTLVRVEHWSNANDQGAAAALNLLAGPENAKPFADLPAFATHMHGARVQIAGLPHLADESRVVTGDPAEGRFAVAFAKDGTLVGAVAVNAPKDLIRIKRAIAAGDHLDALA